MESVNLNKMVNLKYVESIRLDDKTRELIKYHIAKKEMSVRRLAKKLEGTISYTTLNHLLIGRNDVVTINKFKKILQALDLDIEQVLSTSINYFY